MATDHSPFPALEQFDPASLLDALTTGLILLDDRLCALYANVAAQDLLAFSVNQARGRPLTDFLHDADTLKTRLLRALDAGEGIADWELSVRLASAPRESRTLDVTITPVDSPPGARLLLELADAAQRQRVTRENDLMARLDGSRLMIRQLAHEIKNPLGGLRGAAQLLERELPAAALKEYTQVIIGEADRLAALVDSMAGPKRLSQKSLLNVHEVCEHVYRLLRAEAGEHISLERDYDPSLPNGVLDRNQIIQALLNLGRNALQALGLRGQITLRTRALTAVTIGSARHRLVASIQVEDDGPGVPQALRSSLFYPLVTGRPDGTGLGLAVAQELVCRNGGLIEFDSEPGRTVFTLLLPLGETG